MKKVFLFIFILVSSISYSQSSFNVDSILKVISTSNEDSSQIKSYIEIGEYYIQNDYDSAIHYFQISLKLSKDFELQKFEGISFKKLGIVNYHKGNFKTALKYYDEALMICKETNNLQEETKILNNIGIVYGRQGDYEKTLDYLLEALQIDRKVGDKKNIAISIGNIGIIYRITKQYDKSIYYFEQSIALQKEIGEEYFLAACYNGIGSVYYDKKMYDKSLENYTKGLALAKIHDKNGISNFYVNIGLIHDDLGNLALAEENYKHAENTYKEAGHSNGLAVVYETLAKLYIKTGQYHKSIECAKKGLDIALDKEIQPVQANAYRNMSDAFKELGDYEKAYGYHVQYKKVTDSIFTNNMSEQITEMQTKFESESHHSENEILRVKNEVSSLKASKSSAQRNMLVVLLILSTVVIVIITRRYIIKQNANKLLAEKNNLIIEQKEQLSDTLQKVRDLNMELNKQKAEIENHRNNLEDIVKDRTFELQEKIEELERYHKLFISREFRIKELRDEIKDLKVILSK